MATNEKLQLLKFIGINTGLIRDFTKSLGVNNPDIEILLEILKLYQENEEYRNKLEGIMTKDYIDLTFDMIAMKQKYEPDHL